MSDEQQHAILNQGDWHVSERKCQNQNAGS